MNEGGHPPVIYPGSIERVDFGEAADRKYFVIAQVERGNTQVEWRELTEIRPFIDLAVDLQSTPPEEYTAKIRASLPDPTQLTGAVVRLTLTYPRDRESMIDDASLLKFGAEAFDFRIMKHPLIETRIRLPHDQAIGALGPLELLELYWRANHTSDGELADLQKLAASVIDETTQPDSSI